MKSKFYVSEGVILFRRRITNNGTQSPEIWSSRAKSWRVYGDMRDFWTTTHQIDVAAARRLIGTGNLFAEVNRNSASLTTRGSR